MDILMVTAELSPYARASRVGDSVAALAKALCQLEHRVTVAVPRYPGFEAGNLLAARRLTPLDVGGGRSVTVLDGQLPTGPTLVLFDAPALFDRPGIYGDGSDYGDNPERFGLLCAAGAALARARAAKGEPFDVVHLHDWPAAPLALESSKGVSAATVLTLHGGSQRFVVAKEEAAALGLAGAEADAFREGGGLSLVAAAARIVDAVTAPSPTVASDLRDGTRYGALAAALGSRVTGATGILGGLDYSVWNPATDSALRSRYDAEDTSNKGRSKTDLLKRAGLDLAIERPLVVFLVEDEASALLVERAAPELFRSDVSLLVAVRGDPQLGERLSLRLEKDERLAVEVVPDDAAARRACAAADFLVLPADYEVSATWARAAQRYGALPVARASGAHVDAIVDCDADLETGTGFLFDDGTKESLLGAIGRGLAAYTSARFPLLRRRVMRLDLAWDRPARRYVQVYRQAIADRTRAVSAPAGG